MAESHNDYSVLAAAAGNNASAAENNPGGRSCKVLETWSTQCAEHLNIHIAAGPKPTPNNNVYRCEISG